MLSAREVEAGFHLALVRVRDGLDMRKALGALQASWGFPVAKADGYGPGGHGIPEIGRQELSYFKNLTENQKAALADVLDIVDKLYEANGGHWDGIDPWDATKPLDEWKAATMAALAVEPMKAFLIGQSLATAESIDLQRRLGSSGHGMMRPILPEDRRIIDYLTHYSLNEIDSKFEDLKHELRNQLVGGIARGANPKEVARAMRNIGTDYVTDWETIAITETARAESQGRLQEFKDQNFSQVVGSSAHDSRVCDDCLRLLDGKVYDISAVAHVSNYGRKKADWVACIPLHPNCVVGGQEVVTPHGRKAIELIRPGEYVLTHRSRFRRVLSTSSREHSGVVFDVGGLRVTGNHPVLTPEGFRLASSLSDVSDILGVSRVAWLDVRADDTNNAPTQGGQSGLFRDILSALSFRPGVPSATVNFDGKHRIWNSDVDIESVYSILRDCEDVELGEALHHRLFESTQRWSRLPINGALTQALDGVRHAARGVMGGIDLSLASIGSHRTPLDLLGLGAAPPLQSQLLKPSVNGMSRSTRFLRNLLDRFAFEMLPVPLANAGIVRANLLPPLVRSARTTSHNFFGHVYDLQVCEDESFVVEGVSVHNCRDVWLPYSKELASAA